jgi:hypothetical protein
MRNILTVFIKRFAAPKMQRVESSDSDLAQQLQKLHITAPKSKEISTVIYHAGCFDGFGSAFAAWKLLVSSFLRIFSDRCLFIIFIFFSFFSHFFKGSGAQYIAATHRMREYSLECQMYPLRCF